MIKAQKDLCVCFVIIINPPPNHNTCKRYRRNDRSVVVHKISYAFLPIYNVVLRSNILKENKNICWKKQINYYFQINCKMQIPGPIL